MIRKINKTFKREHLSSPKDIFIWWTKGLGFLNLSYLFYVIFHLTIIVTVFQNGWFFFLLPIILTIGLLINFVYLTGFITEIILSKMIKLKIDFNRNSPKIKVWLIVISVLIVMIFSIYDILNN